MKNQTMGEKKHWLSVACVAGTLGLLGATADGDRVLFVPPGVTVMLSADYSPAPTSGELYIHIDSAHPITGGTVKMYDGLGGAEWSITLAPHGEGFVSGGTYSFPLEFDHYGDYYVENIDVAFAEWTTVSYGSGGHAFADGSVTSVSIPWICEFDPWSPECGGGGWEEYYLSSLSVTPGVANVTSAAQTLSFQIDYTSMQGGQPSGSATLRPPSPLVSPIVVDLSLTTHTPDEWGLGGTFTFSREFPTGTLSGQWIVDLVFEDFASFTQFPYFAAGAFTVQDDAVGGAPENPVIPDEVTADGGFRFDSIPAGTPKWIDPPMAFGYLYEVENAATITGIANLPPGIDEDGEFTISAPSFEKQVDVSDAVDFVTELGAGTKWFAITGIEPGADATNGQAFPIRVAFDRAATVKVTPLLMPELLLAVVREGGEMVATASWQGQDELAYQLYRSTDLHSWQPAGEVLAGIDGEQRAEDRSTDGSVSYRLGLIVPLTP